MFADPDAIDGVACRLRAAAEGLRWRVGAHEAHVRGVLWESAAADAARARVHEHRRAVEHLADELDSVAAAVARHADVVRQRIVVARAALSVSSGHG